MFFVFWEGHMSHSLEKVKKACRYDMITSTQKMKDMKISPINVFPI